jgi:hypothetical protein
LSVVPRIGRGLLSVLNGRRHYLLRIIDQFASRLKLICSAPGDLRLPVDRIVWLIENVFDQLLNRRFAWQTVPRVHVYPVGSSEFASGYARTVDSQDVLNRGEDVRRTYRCTGICGSLTGDDYIDDLRSFQRCCFTR